MFLLCFLCISILLTWLCQCFRSGNWSLCCASRVTPPDWCGRPQVTPGARPSASMTSSTDEGRSPTAPPNTLRTCSAWRSTNTKTDRSVLHSETETITLVGSVYLKFRKRQTCARVSLGQGLFSSVICPGLVMTNLTYGILPSFFWTLIMPIMWLVGCTVIYEVLKCILVAWWSSVCCRITDPDFHQHFYTDAVQRSGSTGL